MWKTIGLDFVPGWEQMFGGVGAQYPRRVERMSTAWSYGYLLVYGCFGTVATLSGLAVTRLRGSLSSTAGDRVSRHARVLGAFHTILGVHHTAWAITRGDWGHLKLEQFDAPGIYLLGGAAGFATGLHGLRLLTSRPETPTHRIVRSKIAVDGVSCLTFVSVVVCFLMNTLGQPRNPEFERVLWLVVFMGPVLWLGADLNRNQ